MGAESEQGIAALSFYRQRVRHLPQASGFTAASRISVEGNRSFFLDSLIQVLC